MKITCLIDNLSAGGAQRQIVMLAKLLNKASHEVTVLTYYPQNFFLPDIINSGVNYVCIDEPRILFRIYKIRKTLKLLNQDLVISYLKTPVFLAELSSIPHKKWKLIISERNADISNDKQLLYRRFFHLLSDYVIVNSYSNQMLINKNAPWLKKVETIYNCVDLEYFSPSAVKKNTLLENKLKIVAVGKYSNQKNIIGFINAVYMAFKKHQLDMQIDWYGDEVLNSNIYKEAVSEIKRLNLGHIFFLHGPSNSILEIYRKSSFLILPSFYEGIPNVVCEAMSCGLPILASNVCDNKKLVIDMENGYLFDPNDISSISDTLVKFSKLTYDEKQLMGDNSRKNAEQLFSEDIFIEKYLKIIEGL